MELTETGEDLAEQRELVGLWCLPLLPLHLLGLAGGAGAGRHQPGQAHTDQARQHLDHSLQSCATDLPSSLA